MSDQDVTADLGLMEIIKETQIHPISCISPAYDSPKLNNTKPCNRRWKCIACKLGHNDIDIPDSRKRLGAALTEASSSEQRKKIRTSLEVSVDSTYDPNTELAVVVLQPH